ncbi:hypothetical protein GCM10023189_37740 [Nibrella saemangeumensis]|uniref:HTH arsR-type domain-containing protein n=1 Tax=Nibrella saemangeumensis TaxID=1084526 RepID=A0ABP8N9B8_9BACT
MTKQEAEEVAEILSQLGNPIRLAILLQLQKQDWLTGADLLSPSAKSNINFHEHLKALQDIGLVQRKMRGTKFVYSLSDDRLNQVLDLVATLK